MKESQAGTLGRIKLFTTSRRDFTGQATMGMSKNGALPVQPVPLGNQPQQDKRLLLVQLELVIILSFTDYCSGLVGPSSRK